MACNYPIQAYRLKSGEIVFDTKKGYDIITYLKVPCGQCVGCRLERARQWAVRCTHEASLYDQNCFITLTYNDAHLPIHGDLVYDEFQRFMKRLRKKFGGYLPTRHHQGPIRKIRFFMCGEYGEDHRRPHFHACIFNLDFDDRVYHKTSPSGSKIFTSVQLQNLWSDKSGNPIGYATIGNVSFDSAGYVARYCMKKSKETDPRYNAIDLETGEIYKLQREFVRMSLKPGIGTGFYKKWKSDIFPHDHCVIRGYPQKPPRFYTKKLKDEDPMMHEDLMAIRESRALARASDNIQERLEVKEVVLIAKTRSLKREAI